MMLGLLRSYVVISGTIHVIYRDSVGKRADRLLTFNQGLDAEWVKRVEVNRHCHANLAKTVHRFQCSMFHRGFHSITARMSARNVSL